MHLVQIHKLGPALIAGGPYYILTNTATGVPEYQPVISSDVGNQAVLGSDRGVYVNIADIFLASASFDNTTNILTLTLSDATTVTVDMTDYIGYTFTLAGSAGPNQTISIGDTMTVLGANGFAAITSATDTVTITPPTGTTTGQYMTWNNGTSTWSAQNPTLDALFDAVITAPASTEVLAYNGTNWVNTNGCTWLGNFSIDCLSDVTVVAPGVGDYLAWNGTAWVNTAPAGGFTSFDVAADAGPNQTIGNLNVLTLIGGTNISTLASAGDNVTINMDPFSIDFLSDVDTTGVAVNNTLVWTGAQWEDVSGCTWLGNFSIDCLSDVVLTAPAAGNVLTYNGTNWVNSAPAAQSFTVTGNTGSETISNGDTFTLVGATGINVAVTATDTATITPVIDPIAGNTLTTSAAGLRVRLVEEEYTNVVNGTTTLTLAAAPLAGTLVQLYRDGVKLAASEFSVAGVTITLTVAVSTAVNAPVDTTDFTAVYYR